MSNLKFSIMKHKIILGSLALTLFGFLACQKSDQTLSSASLATSLSVASADIVGTQVAEVSASDVQSVSVEKFDGSDHAFQFDGIRPNWRFDGLGPIRFGIPHIDSCATVTVSGSAFPRQIVIDYGSGCTDRMGHVKKGKILITISDSIIVAGAKKTITYQDFYIDSIKVELTASVENLGKNDSGRWVIESKSSQTITNNSEKSVRVNDETMEWVSGFETTNKSDDVYYKSGSGSITLNDTVTFSRKITKPLLIDRSCGFIKSGTIELTKGSSVVVVDYGDGTCDSIATVTANGATETIDLHHSQYNEGGEFNKHCGGFGHKGKH
jgi:hypothetical protein